MKRRFPVNLNRSKILMMLRGSLVNPQVRVNLLTFQRSNEVVRMSPCLVEYPTEATSMTKNDDVEKVARFQAALNQLIERIAEDRYVLAIVLVGSLSPETIWHRETLGLWIIEADGVSRRLP